MSEQVETFIKKAKTAAGMIQADLAKAVEGITASDTCKAERGAEAQSAAPSKEVPAAAGAAPDLPKADAAPAQEAPCAEQKRLRGRGEGRTGIADRR